MRTVIFLAMIVVICHGKPQQDNVPQQQGPCVGMDCLHGVLMHNDGDQTGDHKAEDQYLRFKDALDTEKPKAGPLDAAQEFHGRLMHGDEEAGSHHEEKAAILPEVAGEAGPKDLNEYMHEAMHGEESKHKHEWDEAEKEDKNGVQKGPEGDKLMHGLLMHGDADYVHEDKPDDGDDPETKVKVNVGGEDVMHGIMHGDAKGHHDHGDDHGAASGKEDGKMRGPDGDLHGILMHGDSELGHDHSDDHNKDSTAPFGDLAKLLEMELEADLLKIIDIEAILELLQKDKSEYDEYVKSQPEGSTFASVSDSLWNDMELMKLKYLSASNNIIDDLADTKNLPFTADDARMALGDDGVMAEDGEDMRHNLELLGSTEPINARHKVSLEMMRAKSKEEI